MTKAKSRKTDQKHPIPVCLLTGWLFGCAALAAMLALSAFVMSFFGLPSAAAKLAMLISVSVGALISGFMTARKAGRNILLCGLLAGIILFTAVLLCALSGRQPVLSDLARLPVYLAAAMTGAVLGAPRASSVRSVYKRR
ncbi:MAG: TIGR04086 family membrane protein [Oscillospiraceae bacterium]|nr:TIGR04086 family membrane protein [Oscillospiraceae bacterium]